MREELDKKLCEKYPLIFRNRYAPMNETAMCWGFSCGDGWYDIIDTLCALLTNKYNQAKERYEYAKECFETKGGMTDWGKPITAEEVEERRLAMEKEAEYVPLASQVKEKFGGLRFYIDRGTDEHFNYIYFAELMSYKVCEECGAPGKTYRDGWHRTLCDTHAKGRESE